MTIKYAVVSARYTFAAIALVVTLLSGCFEKPAFKNVDITGAEYARKLELTDQNGKKRSLAEFKGKAVAVFFGFTQCPDVCPSALGELAQVKAALGKDADRLQVIFVTVDPERDTPAILKAYLANFDKQALGLSGSLDETAASAKEFKVFFQKVRGRTEGSYTIDHTAGSYIIDPAGNIRLFVRHGSNIKWLVDDIKVLLS